MGDLWRSKEMQLVQLILQLDSAQAIVEELAKEDIIQFKDVCCIFGGNVKILKLFLAERRTQHLSKEFLSGNKES